MDDKKVGRQLNMDELEMVSGGIEKNSSLPPSVARVMAALIPGSIRMTSGKDC